MSVAGKTVSSQSGAGAPDPGGQAARDAAKVRRHVIGAAAVTALGGLLFGAPGVFLGVCVSNLAVGLLAGVWAWRAAKP